MVSNGFLELTSKVEAFLIGQLRVFFDDRGERLERVACEAEAIFVDYLHRLPAALHVCCVVMRG